MHVQCDSLAKVKVSAFFFFFLFPAVNKTKPRIRGVGLVLLWLEGEQALLVESFHRKSCLHTLLLRVVCWDHIKHRGKLDYCQTRGSGAGIIPLTPIPFWPCCSAERGTKYRVRVAVEGWQGGNKPVSQRLWLVYLTAAALPCECLPELTLCTAKPKMLPHASAWTKPIFLLLGGP